MAYSIVPHKAGMCILNCHIIKFICIAGQEIWWNANDKCLKKEGGSKAKIEFPSTECLKCKEMLLNDNIFIIQLLSFMYYYYHHTSCLFCPAASQEGRVTWVWFALSMLRDKECGIPQMIIILLGLICCSYVRLASNPCCSPSQIQPTVLCGVWTKQWCVNPTYIHFLLACENI